MGKKIIIDILLIVIGNDLQDLLYICTMHICLTQDNNITYALKNYVNVLDLCNVQAIISRINLFATVYNPP